MMKRLLAAAALAILFVPTAESAEGDSVQATLSGNGVSGTVTLTETASGVVLVNLDAKGIPEGVHGFHIHETGLCDAADGFKSAGGHLSGGKHHGIDDAEGPHPGDMPNVHVASDSSTQVEFFVTGLALTGDGPAVVTDGDGSAVILHAGTDDYTSQPSGDAGARLACGVFAPS